MTKVSIDGRDITKLRQSAAGIEDANHPVVAMPEAVSAPAAGSATAPDDKLIVTSAEAPVPGDVVIASGTLRRDVDIGSGYLYKVLLEETSFSQ